MAIIIDKEQCEGCATCMGTCTSSAIVMEEIDGSLVAVVVPELCNECGDCIEFCMRGLIKKPDQKPN